MSAGAQGDHDACLSYLEKVLQHEPRNEAAIYLMAVQHGELGLIDRAIDGIKTALAIDPGMDIARFQLGLLLLFDQQRARDARDQLTPLLQCKEAALRAFADALIAIADADLNRARQQLAVGLSAGARSSTLSALMSMLFNYLVRKDCTAQGAASLVH
jgi:tetratricopeptide (TPR) repeat protein